jgi:hypothetical protein
LKRALAGVFFALLAIASSRADDMEQYNAKWQELESEGRFAEASRYFRKAIAEHPHEAWLYVFVGYSELKLSHFKDGISFLEKAAGLAPTNAEIRASLGYGYASYADRLSLEEGRVDDASDLYAKAIECQPRNARYHVLLAHTLSASERFEDALEILASALKLGAATDPNNLPAVRDCVLRGALYFRTRLEPGNAISFGVLGLKAFPGDTEISIGLFLDYAREKQFAKAEGVASHVAGRLEKNVLLAALLLFQGDEKEAEAGFDKASADLLADYMTDELIASVYRVKMELLEAEELGFGADREKIKEYESIAVRKYFTIHPYKQSIQIIPPIRSEFTISRDEGEDRSLAGLSDYYRFDLERYEEDSFGTPVVAVCDGSVIEAAMPFDDEKEEEAVDRFRLPNRVKIDHNGVIGIYENLRKSTLLVRPGDKVRAGQIIGEIGSAARGGRAFLRFSVQTKDGIALPIRFTRLAGRMPSERKYSQATELLPGYVYVSK